MKKPVEKNLKIQVIMTSEHLEISLKQIVGNIYD